MADLREQADMRHRTCGLDDCEDQHYAKGYCRKHYWLWRKHGDPRVNLRPDLGRTPEQRFWAKVDKGGPIPDRRPELGPCWVWMGATADGGYGSFRVDGGRRTVTAHRWGYLNFVGPIPDGLHLDHLCHNPPCVRPDHLEPVPPLVNWARGDSPAAVVYRTGICSYGHSPEDAYVTEGGYRVCRKCTQRRNAERLRNPADSASRRKRNPDAKYRRLSAEQNAEIKRLWMLGGITQAVLAARFGCSQATISAVVNGTRKGTCPLAEDAVTGR